MAESRGRMARNKEVSLKYLENPRARNFSGVPQFHCQYPAPGLRTSIEDSRVSHRTSRPARIALQFPRSLEVSSDVTASVALPHPIAVRVVPHSLRRQAKALSHRRPDASQLC
jgi:hypothetical protein